MADGFVVAVVHSTRAWPGRLHAYVDDHVTNCRVVVVRDDRAALEAGAHVLLVDDTTPWLTSRFVDRATAQQLPLIGVYDDTDGPSGRARLQDLGLRHLVEGSASPEQLVHLLKPLRPAVASGTPPRSLAEAVRGVPAQVPASEGLIVATGGPSGSGARELAVGLATRWALDGWSTVLVDLNETTPGVAGRLGIPLYPHVLSAIDRLRVDGAASIRTTVADRVATRPFDVIPGLPQVREWDRLQPADTEHLLLACAGVWERVVVTTSPLIEDMRRWVDRFGVSRRTLQVADVVVGCTDPTPRGLVRYLEWLAEATILCQSTIAVVNRLPKNNSRVGGQLRNLITESAGTAVNRIVEVPQDAKVERAEWDGALRTGGAYAKAIGILAAVVDEVAEAELEAQPATSAPRIGAR